MRVQMIARTLALSGLVFLLVTGFFNETGWNWKDAERKVDNLLDKARLRCAQSAYAALWHFTSSSKAVHSKMLSCVIRT